MNQNNHQRWVIVLAVFALAVLLLLLRVWRSHDREQSTPKRHHPWEVRRNGRARYLRHSRVRVPSEGQRPGCPSSIRWQRSETVRRGVLPGEPSAQQTKMIRKLPVRGGGVRNLDANMDFGALQN